MSYTYPYPHPAIAADCIVFGFTAEGLQLLLIERKNEPCTGMWAFPGGFMDIDETAEAAALRELKEETGLVVRQIKQFGAFSTVKRDPRERVVSIAYYTVTQPAEVHGGDDARKAEWFPLRALPPLAFDHKEILLSALMQLYKDCLYDKATQPVRQTISPTNNTASNRIPESGHFPFRQLLPWCEELLFSPLLRTAPDCIRQLKPHEVFVFGSNLQGMHGGGAAYIAVRQFGAIMGQVVGLQGQSYAIPTMHGGVEAIAPYVDQFIGFAQAHPELTFLVTRIGCGIGGFREEEMAPLFREAVRLPNICLPDSFWRILTAPDFDSF